MQENRALQDFIEPTTPPLRLHLQTLGGFTKHMVIIIHRDVAVNNVKVRGGRLVYSFAVVINQTGQAHDIYHPAHLDTVNCHIAFNSEKREILLSTQNRVL